MIITLHIYYRILILQVKKQLALDTIYKNNDEYTVTLQFITTFKAYIGNNLCNKW